MREQRRSSWRRGLRLVGRTLLGSVITIAMLVLVGLGWINSRQGKAWVLRQAHQRIHPRVPGLQLGQLTGFLPFGAKLEHVRLADLQGRPVLQAGVVSVNLALWPLLSHQLKLYKLHIEQPDLHAVREVNGRWNVQQLAVPSKKKRPLRWKITIEKLELSGGQLTVVQRQRTTGTLREVALQGAIGYQPGLLSTTLPLIDFQYELGTRHGSFHANARAQLTPARIKARIEGQLGGLWTQEMVPILATAEGPRRQLQTMLHVGRPQRGELQASALLNLREGSYTLQATVGDLQLQTIEPRWPASDINLALNAQGKGVPLLPASRLEARLSSRGLRIAGQRIEQLQATVRSSGPRWQLAQLQARGPGAHVQAEGAGTGRAFHLTARIATEELGPLQLGKQQLRVNGRLALALVRERSGRLELTGSTELPALSYGKFRLRGLAARLNAHFDVTRGSGGLHLWTDRPFTANQLRFQRARAVARADGKVLRVEATATPRGTQSLAPAQLNATLPLSRAQGSLHLARNEPIDIRAHWPGVSLQNLGGLLGTKLKLGGELWVVLRVDGTLAKPRVHAQAALRKGRYRKLRDVGALLQLFGDPAQSRLTLRASLGTHPVLTSEASWAAGPRELLAQRGWLRVPVELNAHLPGVSTSRLAPLAPALARLPGRLRAKLSLSGTMRDPRLSLVARTDGEHPVGLRVRGHVQQGRSLVHAALRLQNQALLHLIASVPLTPEELLRRRQLGPVPVRARGTVGPVDLATLAYFAPRLRPAAGRLHGDFAFAGTFPALQGELTLAGEQLRLKGRALGDLRSSVRSSTQAALLDMTLQQGAGSAKLEAKADEVGALKATLVATNLDLGSLRQIWPKGPLAEDKVSGKLLAEGKLLGESGQARARREVPPPLARLLGREPIRGEVKLSGLRLGLHLRRAQPKPLPVVEHIDDRLRRMRPFHLSRFAVSESELHLVDETLAGRPVVNLHRFALTLENLASRREFMAGAPALLTFRAVVEQSGETTGFATFDPLAPEPLAAGRVVMRGLRLVEIQRFLQPLFEARAERGTFSFYFAFRLKGDQLSGGIKPIVTNPKLEPIRSAGWLRSLGIESAELLSKIFGAKVQGREAVATVIPIEGKVERPDIELLPALLIVVRNAFVVGIAANFAHLPPPMARERQSIFTQARQALSKKSFPEAQPPKQKQR